MYNSVQEKYQVKETKYGSILFTFPLWFHICFTCNGLMILTIIQAVKIQYGQRSEPVQTKPIQNRHKHCTSQF
jgi:hypothetical protein